LIRTSYPIPPIEMLKLRIELATRRTRRALEQRRRELRAATEQKSASQNDYLRVRWIEDLKRERDSYQEFYERYDALVGLLCLAAHQGVTSEIESEYRAQRAYFVGAYPKIKSFVSHFLEFDPSDTQPVLWGRRSCDGFEALFSSPSVVIALDSDGGNLIGRMMRSQAALTEWEGSLLRREEAAENGIISD